MAFLEHARDGSAGIPIRVAGERVCENGYTGRESQTDQKCAHTPARAAALTPLHPARPRPFVPGIRIRSTIGHRRGSRFPRAGTRHQDTLANTRDDRSKLYAAQRTSRWH